MATRTTRYADPARCPDCWASLSGPHCAECGLDLSHPDATELFGYFTRADDVLNRMRARKYAAAMAPPTVPPVVQPAVPPSTPPSTPPVDAGLDLLPLGPDEAEPARLGQAGPAGITPGPAAAVRPSGGLAAASVPRILLGLGALCLLVAAVVFLALAWSWLGVGGRTAVLVAFTVAAGTLAWWFEGRGLRWAAEAFATVGFGLLLLDVMGAQSAGWLGDLGDGGLLCIVGVVFAVAALATSYLTEPAMIAPQLVAPLAVSAVGVGVWILADTTSAPVLLGCLLTAGLAVLGGRLGTRAMELGSWATFAMWWLTLTGIGVFRALDDPTLRGLWLELGAWPLLAAAGFLGAGAWLVRREPGLLGALGGAALTAVGFLLVLPALTGPNRSVLVLLLVAAILAAALVRLPAPWRSMTLLPLAIALLGPVTAGAGLVALHLAHAIAQPPLAATWDERLGGAPAGGLNPLLLPLIALVALAALGSLTTLRPDPRGDLRALAPLAGLAAGIAATATLTAYPVPRIVAVAVALLAAAALTFLPRTPIRLRLDRSSDGQGSQTNRSWGVAAGVAWLLVTLLALPSAGLTLVVALAVAALGYRLATGERDWQVALGECLVPVAAYVAILCAARIGDLPGGWFGVAVVAVLGVTMQLRSSLVWLGAHTLVGAAGVVAALDNAGAHTIRIAAITLTLAGAAYLASALLRPDRRWLAVPGGVLLVAASWVELAARDVTVPEAYTLPAALVLTALGAWRLLRDPALSTALALGPGLALATISSLGAVLVDGSPVSLRGALLGAACLVLVLGGVGLRLAAPLVVGAAVGTALVVQFLWPYAGEVPPWILIALAGAVLTVVGITWERRVRDVRAAGAYLAALR